MSDKAPAWVVPVMQAGYAARAIVYVTVGVLALLASIYGGQAQGTTNALADLRGSWWGVLLLWIVGLGLLCYAAWRFIDAWMDLDTYGSDAKGIFARLALVVTGLVHAALGISALGLAMGDSSGGGNAESLTARVMQMPYGRWLVGLIGLGILGAGIYYAYKGYSRRYQKDIRTNRTTLKLDPLMRGGFLAEGLVVGIVGALVLYAAFTTNPEQAGGIGQALTEIRSVAYGRIALGIVALGLIFFGIENAVEAKYRIVKARAGDSVETLAQRAKNSAERGARKAGA
ncbi:DUF1206 domain-containing protein [Citreimonas salinaria]|uniref:DUF1206 domain-containing protein n=1 Tax=Citreimonas salinaria TaxID=321339 RepID=A0A1H3K2G9_9RHOB|nr:DUF1206 domain-containing protein [Citreimonas salinaria]SDY45798.1 protein of unknown function [Citreimonas salinaria]